MKTRTLLTAAAVLALLVTGSAPAEAGYISGRLTVLNNAFILKLRAPVESDISPDEDGSEIATSDRVQVIPVGEERRAELRALVGKWVQLFSPVLKGAETPYNSAPFLLMYDENSEGFEEINAPEAATPATRQEAATAPVPLAEGIDYSDDVRPYREPLE